MESDRPLRFSSNEIEAEFLTCPVCKGNLVNTDTSQAHLLPCLHAICRSCLLINIRGEGQHRTQKINCVVCGEGHDLKSSNVKKAFPVDNTRPDLWEYIQTKKTTAAIECASVNCNNGKNATARCVDCAEFLCNDCTLAHQRNSRTSHHGILDIFELKETENLKAFHKPLACSLHGEPLLCYCLKVSCQKPVCFMCVLTSCKESEGHTIISLEETVAQLKLDLAQQMKSLGTKKHEIQNVGTLVEKEVEKLEERKEMLESDIDSTIDGMIQMLESKRAELKTTLRKKIDTKRQHLNEQKKSLDGKGASISQGLRLAETALCSTNNAAFSQLENPIRKRFDRLEHDPFDRKPHERAAQIKFDTLNAKQALQKILNESVEVWSTSVFPPFTTIEICGEPRENTLTKISICLHDYQKRPVDQDVSAGLKIFVVDPSEKKMELQLTKGNLSEDLVVSYVPFSTGKHEISVELLGEDVGRKAFIVDCADGKNTQCENSCQEATNRDTGKRSFTFDSTIAHPNVTVSENGMSFENFTSLSSSPSLCTKRFRRFKGTRGSLPFKTTDIATYNMSVRFWVRQPLGKSQVIFEIGLALETSIDNNHHVDGQPFCWSMVGFHHHECDAICLVVAHRGQVLCHEKMAENRADCIFQTTFSFKVDMKNGRWEILKENRKLCSVEINSDNPLFPVISGYNPSKVWLKVNLKDC